MFDTKEANSEPQEWHHRFMGHLAAMQPRYDKTRERRLGDSGAFAELRSAARGGAFVFRAYPHVVPFIPEHQVRLVTERRIEIAVLVAQLYATHRPTRETDDQNAEDETTHRQRNSYRTVGELLGLADAANRNDELSSEPKNETPFERTLKTTIAADRETLDRQLRQALVRIRGQKVELLHGDFVQLCRDLDKWEQHNYPTQKRWVRDFYRARYQGAQKRTTGGNQ